MLALVLPRFRERLTDPARGPPDALPVEILMLAYPVSLPPPGAVPPDGAAAMIRPAANRLNQYALPRRRTQP